MADSPLEIPELVDTIISFLPLDDIISLRCVSTKFMRVIDRHIQLRQSGNRTVQGAVENTKCDTTSYLLICLFNDKNYRVQFIIENFTDEDIKRTFNVCALYKYIENSYTRWTKNAAIIKIIEYIKLFDVKGLKLENFHDDLKDSILKFDSYYISTMDRMFNGVYIYSEKKYYNKEKKCTMRYTHYWEACRVLCKDITFTEHQKIKIQDLIIRLFHKYNDYRTALALDDIITNWEFADDPRRKVDYTNEFWQEYPSEHMTCDTSDHYNPDPFLNHYKEIVIWRDEQETGLRIWVPKCYF